MTIVIPYPADCLYSSLAVFLIFFVFISFLYYFSLLFLLIFAFAADYQVHANSSMPACEYFF